VEKIMRVSHYVLKSDGEEIAKVHGNSRGGYAVVFANHPDRVHALQKARRVRDVLPYVRALANVWSESELVVDPQAVTFPHVLARLLAICAVIDGAVFLILWSTR
jgi:hypothetical protein